MRIFAAFAVAASAASAASTSNDKSNSKPAAPLFKCSSDLDCSLAGKCVNGACECESWTKGDDCAALNLTPLASASDLKSVMSDSENMTRWGGTVVQDPRNSSKYHLFNAEMAYGCGLNVWTCKSQVSHGVSVHGPHGPFHRRGVAIPTEAHNPVVSRDPVSGTYLIWTCGCPHESKTEDCSVETVTCGENDTPGAWTTTVYSSDSLEGPWVPHVDVLGNITLGRLGSQNVSPYHHADGSVTLMFKGPDNNTEASVATAPHWSGPYTLGAVNIFAKYYAQNITNEDVFLWQHPDGSFHAFSHRMDPDDRGSFVSGGHAFTEGLDKPWSYALTPAYTDELDVAGAQPIKLKRRERPQVFLDPKTGYPTLLTNGVMAPNGDTFTFVQSLGP